MCSLEKLLLINKWYVATSIDRTIDSFEISEFYSYLNNFTDEMFDLVLILNHYNFDASKIFDWSKKGELVLYLESSKNYITDIKNCNIETYNGLVSELKENIMQTDDKLIQKVRVAI